MALFPKAVRLIRKKTDKDILFIGSGIIPRKDVPKLREAGIAQIFGPGTVEDVDTAMKLGYNLPMGPLELGDLVGLDTRLNIANAMYDATKDPKFAPPVLLQKMVAAGWLGRKTGKGFYEYNK